MNIVIAGDGEVGFHLAKLLSQDNKHNITIIDPHQDLLQLLEAHSDILTITGDSTEISILESARVNRTDLLISVLHDQRTNIITCMLGSKLGAKRTIARIDNAEYLSPENTRIFKEMGIDELVCPEFIAAMELEKLVRQNSTTEIFDFSDHKLALFLIKMDHDTTVLNQSLNQIAQANPNLPFRAIAIYRDSKTIIPKGEDRFLEGDLAYVITKPEGVNMLLELSGKKVSGEIKNVMIAGGGRIGRKTAIRLENKFNVKLIESQREKGIRLTNYLHNTLIIHGDACNVELLEDEGIGNMDAFIAVTDDSETNILICMLAKQYGVERIIPLIENVDYIDIARNIGLERFINKKLITASHIAKFTMNAEVASVKLLDGVNAEVMEFVAQPGSAITKQPICKLNLPTDAIIGGIIRGEDGYIAIGNMQIQDNDRVVVFALPKAVSKIGKFFD